MVARRALAWGLVCLTGCTATPASVAPPPSVDDVDERAEPETISGPTEQRQRQWMIACEPPPPPPPPPPGRPVDEEERERFSKLVRQFREAVGVDTCAPEPWLRRQAAYPDIEGLYCVLSVVYDVCEQPDQAVAWARARAEHFPDRAEAWLALATRRFDALWPIPGSFAPFNEALSGSERYALANAVIADLRRAIELDPGRRDPFVYLAMAYTQRQFSRYVPATPRSDRELLDALLASEDAHLANQAARKICKLESIPECTGTPGPSCCPPPLFSPAELQAFSREKKALIGRLGPGALDEPTLTDPSADASPPSVRDQATDVELVTLMSNAVYVPDPDAKALAATQTGMFSKASGATKVAFCVDTQGRTTDIHTVAKFPDDPRIDEICRETVSRWRFRPVKVKGKAAPVCSVMRFDIRFE